MAENRTESTVVFVGNISYEITEEQLQEVFGEVGPIKAFRLMFDKETGKPKGYGFCEYYDIDTASSAVRNLNNYEMMGRELKVNFADSAQSIAGPGPAAGGGGIGGGGGGAGSIGAGRINANSNSLNMSMRPQMNNNNSNPANSMNHGGFVPHAAGLGANVISNNNGGADEGANVSAASTTSATDAITTLLSSMSPHALTELMAQMKQLAVTQPDQVRNLLQKNPPLSYAIFQALLMMNVVTPAQITKILTRVEERMPQPGANPGMMQPPLMPPNMAGMSGGPSAGMMAGPGQQQQQQQQGPGMGSMRGGPMPPLPPFGMQHPPLPQSMGMPPPQPTGPLPPPQQQQQNLFGQGAQGPSQEALIQQVLALPLAAVEQLAPEQRAQVYAIRAQMG